MEHNLDHKDTQELEKQQPINQHDSTDYAAFEDPGQAFICDGCQ